MLKDADFKLMYTSGDDDEPSVYMFDALSNSHSFDLALGYFRSTGFSVLALGFALFIKNGGKMRFIINDSLAEKDKNAIILGIEDQTDEEYEHHLLNDFNKLLTTLTKRNQHFFDCLSWLISSNRLEIVAVVPARSKVGIVHHKFGVFTDRAEDKTAFSGSLNFSQYALQYNIENIWCEYSWDTSSNTRERIDKIINLFEKTWSGQSSSVRIIPIEQVKVALAKKFPKKPIKELIEMECELAREAMSEAPSTEKFKKKIELIINKLNSEKLTTDLTSQKKDIESSKWKHQDKAIALFLKEKRGVLNMATGTGKTRTSLRICKELIDKDQIETIIVSCDGNDLLNQWYKELLKLAQAEQWIVLRHYEKYHQSEKFRNNPQRKIMLISRQQLHLVMEKLSPNRCNKTLLIHDEVHRLGSDGIRKGMLGLSEHIQYRVGLSATPEREYDAEGSQFILDHIGPIIFNFTLEDGIRHGILSPFNYFPIPYELTVNDKARLRAIYTRKAAAAKAGNPLSDEEFWTQLASVYKTSEGKIPVFQNFITTHPEMLRRCVIFVETKEYGEKILDIVHQFHTDFHTYYGGEDASILSRFAKGEIECLLTCHRLSEGIDIQSLKNVILISSAKARLETIQRIGRCLRTDPNNVNKLANVIDFIRENTDEVDSINADQARETFLGQLATIRPEQP